MTRDAELRRRLAERLVDALGPGLRDLPEGKFGAVGPDRRIEITGYDVRRAVQLLRLQAGVVGSMRRRD